MVKFLPFMAFFALFLACGGDEHAQPDAGDSGAFVTQEESVSDEQPGVNVAGEVIYVPVYSSIFYSDAKRTIDLAITLSVHNTDRERTIRLEKVDYHGLKGDLLRKFVEHPVVLKPLETVNFVIEERDKSGGTGANFIVRWRSHAQVTSPIVEAIMISSKSAQGISFMTTGQIIEQIGAD